MNRCIVCYQTNSSPLFAELLINKCSCGHVFYTGDLDNEKIKEIYSLNYFKGEEYLDYKGDKQIHQKNFSNKLKTILNYKTSGKLLEIGSAFGFFLELAKKHFDVKGFEICEEAATYAKNELGLDVVCGDILDDKTDTKYDVITMYDCIEHIPEPDKIIAHLSQVINQGGYLFVTTGDIGQFLPMFQGKDWRLIHPPSHIHYFSKKSLSNLMEKYGFEVVTVNYPGIWRSWALVFDQVFKMPKLAQKMTNKFFWINTFDIMELVVRKK